MRAHLIEQSELVSFCVPPAVQAQLALPALRCERVVLLEKPVADSAEGAQELLSRAAAPTVVHYSRLLSQGLQHWLDTRRAENWTRAEITLANDALLGDNPFGQSPWRRAPSAALWDLGPHAISLAVAALGPVRTVRANLADRILVASLEHSDGRSTQLRCSLAAESNEERYRFVTADGTAHEPDVAFDNAALFARAVDIALNGPVSAYDSACADPDFSVHITAVLEGAARSAAQGRTVRISHQLSLASTPCASSAPQTPEVGQRAGPADTGG